MSLEVTADGCIRQTIQDCLAGDYIEGEKDSSYERMYYQTGMSEPRARIMGSPFRPLNIIVAVARFTWLVSANNRVEDIAYYEPKVRGFSDDGLTVPGSDYGMRLFQPRPGLNQIQGVVDRLKKDQKSRQAAAVVWQPEDAVRQSNDIPCTFGMFFHIRKDQLDMCVNMRSNNAFRILPFNLFEFSMVHELVAASVGIPLGNYHHWAASMHVYHNEKEFPATVNIAMNEIAGSLCMPEMQSELGRWRPLVMARVLGELEAKLRHCCNRDEFDKVLYEAQQLDSYWHALFSILATWTAFKKGFDDYDWTSEIPPYLHGSVELALNK